MYKILIVEDDAVIAGAIARHLESWDFEPLIAPDFKNLLADFAAFGPHLVLMDISLPFYNGYHWCEEIRKLSQVPIIFISSASDNMNIVMAVSAGGDDFVAKPFDLSVLLAKVQAVLRRTYDFSGQTALLEHRGLILNLGDCSVSFQGLRAELSKNENRILSVLLENKGKIVTRDAMMNKLWETDAFVDENTLSVNVTRLRKKLESVGCGQFIKTKKGVGYLVE